MNEAQARELLSSWFGGDALPRLQLIVDAVINESGKQNLVSRGSIDQIWTRHILDSAQLARLSERAGLWLDVGTGAGFPGLVIAALTARPMILCEPRRLRADFLKRVVTSLGRGTDVNVEQRRCETLDVGASTISARAVTTVPRLLVMTQACARSGTEWLLPRGSTGMQELEQLSTRHRKMFHVEQSVSSPDGLILIGRN